MKSFHRKLIRGSARLKKIETCHKNCDTLIADSRKYIQKVHSRTMSDQSNHKQSEQRKVLFFKISKSFKTYGALLQTVRKKSNRHKNSQGSN